jgi:hypothetical protein
MDTLPPFVLGSLKALVLQLVAFAVTIALKHRAARVRAVFLGTAIAGCLVIPLVAPLLPSWTFPVPAALKRFVPDTAQEITVGISMNTRASVPSTAVVRLAGIDTVRSAASGPNVDWTTLIGLLWIFGAAALTFPLAVGSWLVSQALRSSALDRS